MDSYWDTTSYSFDNDEVLTDPFDESTITNLFALYNKALNTEDVQETGDTLTYDLFCYKEYMNCKQNQFQNYVSLKLALTEKLIKLNKIRLQRNLILEPETNYQTNNNEMNEPSMQMELDYLNNYRMELMDSINQKHAKPAKIEPELPILPKLPKRKKKSKKSKKEKRRKLSSGDKENSNTSNDNILMDVL